MSRPAAFAAAVAAVVAAALAGCAVAPTTPPALDTVSGRLALQVAAAPPQAERRAAAHFELRGDAGRGELDLAGPLGTVMARARWSPELTELQTADGTRPFASLSDLAAELLGEPMPLAALSDWLRGRPWAGAAHRRHTEGFEQLGWSVDLSRHAEGVIVARRASAPAMTLRAVLDAAR